MINGFKVVDGRGTLESEISIWPDHISSGVMIVLATDRKLLIVHKVHNFKSGIGKYKVVSSV